MKTRETLVEGKERSWDWAIASAQQKLGKIIGRRGILVEYADAGWCELEWLEPPDTARCEGLPSIDLPTKYRIVKANAK